VRKTERRLPAGYEATDLGEAVVASDSRCAIVSFATAPVVVGRDNTYVLFVTDPALAAAASSFEWTFTEEGADPNVTTGERADIVYRPASIGQLSVAVRILDGGNAEQAALTLEQFVVLPSSEIEALIVDSKDKPGPGASDPDTLRELVNQHCRYYQDAAQLVTESGDTFRQFLFGVAFDGVARRTSLERAADIERLAVALDEQPEDFARLASTGMGVTNLRLALLAMGPPKAPATTPLLPWTELPEASPQHVVADEQLRQALAALSEDNRIDLFNIARFPKSNIFSAARILAALRDRYFSGTPFADVVTGMSGTRARWIINHFRDGPITRA
jgi:hypothetical protein